MDEGLRVAITGANGFVGTNFRRFLSENKIGAASMTRKKMRTFRTEDVILVSDFGQKDLTARIRGCGALVHLVGTGVQTPDADYFSVNVALTRKVISLCKRAGIKKIVYISGLGARPDTTLGYFISKLSAERQIAGSGLDYTILRASYIVGGGDPLTKNLARQAKKGRVVIPGSGSYRLQPISVSDVSRILLKCVTSKRLSNKTLDLVGPHAVSFAEFAKRAVGAAKLKRVDLEKAYHDALNMPRSAAYGLDDLNILVGGFTGDHRRLERLCGFRLERAL